MMRQNKDGIKEGAQNNSTGQISFDWTKEVTSRDKSTITTLSIACCNKKKGKGIKCNNCVWFIGIHEWNWRVTRGKGLSSPEDDKWLKECPVWPNITSNTSWKLLSLQFVFHVVTRKSLVTRKVHETETNSLHTDILKQMSCLLYFSHVCFRERKNRVGKGFLYSLSSPLSSSREKEREREMSRGSGWRKTWRGRKKMSFCMLQK